MTSSSACASSGGAVRDAGGGRVLDWGIALAPRHPHEVPGDAGMVVPVPGGVLVGAVDGVGHGREAARAAQIARRLIRADRGQDLVALVRRCHEALQASRGAALSVALLSAATGRMTWLGVGTVEGRLLSSGSRWTGENPTLPRGRGTAGHELPPLHPESVELRRGDVLVLATDGVSAGFADDLDVSGAPRTVAERVLAEHWTHSDDALVVVVRYMGEAA